MKNVDYIKSEIERLYKTKPEIHISVKLTHPKINVEDAPAKIVGIYRNIFQIEECDSGMPASHTFQYGDVLTGRIVIRELDYAASEMNKKA